MTELAHTSSPDVRTAVQTALAFFRRDFLVAVSYKSAFLADVLGILFKVVTFYYIGALFGGDDLAVARRLRLRLLRLLDHRDRARRLRAHEPADVLRQHSGEPDGGHARGRAAVTDSGQADGPVFVPLAVLLHRVSGSASIWCSAPRCSVSTSTRTGCSRDWSSCCWTILCFAPLGIISAALIMVFKKGTWFQAMVSGTSFLLGGVAYPVEVLPEWAIPLSYFVPLTHSVNAIRQALLNGQGLATPAVLGDVVFLTVFAAVLIPISLWIFERGVNRTRKLGTLTQY